MPVGGAFAGRLGRVVLDLLFPARCVGCGAGGSFLCDACAATMPVAGPPRCLRCWRPGVDGICDRCRSAPPAFDGLFAAYVYTGLAVPLSALRGRTRGYNQAQALGQGLSRELGLPLAPRALQRRRHTPPQARSADAEERRRNVEGAFVAREREVAGRRLLVIDDVTTTGATLSACAAALKVAGARSVQAVAFARED